MSNLNDATLNKVMQKVKVDLDMFHVWVLDRIETKVGGIKFIT